MIQKITHLVETLVAALGGPDVECIQRIPYQGGGLPDSPLFCLKLDVFHRSTIPGYPQRLARVLGAQWLETSVSRSKDRFFLEDVPVHVDFKLVSRVDAELTGLHGGATGLQEETTYGLFRLYHGIPVLTASPWIRSVKAQLEHLPGAFWDFQKKNLADRLEHLLSDLAAAHFNQDGLFFQITLARFLTTLAELLLAHNHRFLGPPEELGFQLEGLEDLPAGFTGYFDGLLRDDASFDRERRLGLARNLAKGALALVR